MKESSYLSSDLRMMELHQLLLLLKLYAHLLLQTYTMNSSPSSPYVISDQPYPRPPRPYDGKNSFRSQYSLESEAAGNNDSRLEQICDQSVYA